MRELKIGDKFVVRSTGFTVCSGNNWCCEMNTWLGKTLTIKEISASGSFRVLENRHYWSPSHNHIDWEATERLYELPEPSKDLLKDGDIITYDDGNQRIVLASTSSIHGNDGEKVNSLKKYNDDLMYTYDFHDGLDISEIHRDGVIIAKRKPIKSEAEIELEKLQVEAERLAERIGELKNKLK